MNKVYKNIIHIFAFAMVFCSLISMNMFICFAVSSKNPSIVINSARGEAGDTVDVTITMSNNPGFVSANLYVKYDESVLTLKKVKDGGLLSGVTHSDNYTSPYGLCWVNDLSTENFKVNGVLATLTFEISKNAKPGKTTISLEQDILDCDIENVVFELGKGSVAVTGASKSTNSSDNVQEGLDSSEKAVKSDSSKVSDGSSQGKNSNVQTVPDGENASSSVAENSVPNQNATTQNADKASSTQDSADKGGSLALWIIISALIVFAIIFVIVYVLHRRR